MTEHRSSEWYAGTDRNSYIHRAWMRRGLPENAFDGRPHIAIANSDAAWDAYAHAAMDEAHRAVSELL